jgi:hypothetical protein
MAFISSTRTAARSDNGVCSSEDGACGAISHCKSADAKFLDRVSAVAMVQIDGGAPFAG